MSPAFFFAPALGADFALLGKEASSAANKASFSAFFRATPVSEPPARKCLAGATVTLDGRLTLLGGFGGGCFGLAHSLRCRPKYEYLHYSRCIHAEEMRRARCSETQRVQFGA